MIPGNATDGDLLVGLALLQRNLVESAEEGADYARRLRTGADAAGLLRGVTSSWEGLRREGEELFARIATALHPRLCRAGAVRAGVSAAIDVAAAALACAEQLTVSSEVAALAIELVTRMGLEHFCATWRQVGDAGG